MTKRIYSSSGGGYPVYSIDGNYIYEGTGGGYPVYRIDGKYIYKGTGGGYPVYYVDGNYIYEGTGGGYPVYRIDGKHIYKGTGGGYPVYTVEGNGKSNNQSASTNSYSASSSGSSGIGDLLGQWIGNGIGVLLIIVLVYFFANSVSDSHYESSPPQYTKPSGHENKASVALRTLNAYVGELYPSEDYATDIEDNKGNIYSEAFSSYAAEHSAVYDIGKKYDVLKGIVAVGIPMSPNETFTGEIKIYGDGQLIWSDTGINSSMEPYKMNVSVSGITDLEVVIDSNGPGPVIFADAVLQKTASSNTASVNSTDNSENISDNTDEEVEADALRTLDAFEGELYPAKSFAKDIKDNMGNTYSKAFSSYAAEHSAVYKIGKRYDVLKGIVAVGKPMTPGETFTGEIKVYGDGQLIWSDSGINSSMKPYEMSVSVSGITNLEIVIDSNGPGPVIFADVVLQKAGK